MEYRNLGKSGLKISVLSYGSWVTYGTQLDAGGAHDCMKLAYDRGVNFFDNAEVYANGQSEEVMGAALQRLGWKRSTYLVSTKLFWGGEGVNEKGLSRKHILEGTDAALRRLRLDYVDLVFCHRPDLHTPIEETVRAMSHLVTTGRALYWGTSEWNAAQLTEAYHLARREHLVPPTMEQPQYNLFTRDRVEKEYAPLYDKLGLGTTIWSPLASGVLTGKYNTGIPADSRLAMENLGWLRKKAVTDDRITKVKALATLAGELGCTVAQLAIAWCIVHPRVSTAILGASRVTQLEENLNALAVVPKLDAAVLQRIDAIVANKPEPEQDWRG